jgi:hypothetical protein
MKSNLQVDYSYNSLNSPKSNIIYQGNKYHLVHNLFYYEILDNNNNTIVHLRECTKEIALTIIKQLDI